MSPRLVRPDGGDGYQGNVIGRFVARHPVAVQVVLILAAVAIVGGTMFAPSCEGAEVERVPLANDAAPLFLAGLADLGGTEWALAAPGNRVAEGNPLGATRTRRVLLKSATSAGALFLVRRMRATGHPNAAKWTKRGLVAAQVLAGGWAISKGLEARRGR